MGLRGRLPPTPRAALSAFFAVPQVISRASSIHDALPALTGSLVYEPLRAAPHKPQVPRSCFASEKRGEVVCCRRYCSF